jgi:hypothetical protein
MTDPAHGWMTLWNFSIEEGSLCMTQTDQRTSSPDPTLLAQMGSTGDIQTTGRRVLATGISGLCRSSVRPIAISCLPLTLRHRRAVQEATG